MYNCTIVRYNMYNCTNKVFITRVAVQLDEGLISHIAGLKLPDGNVWFERAWSDKSITGSKGRV